MNLESAVADIELDIPYNWEPRGYQLPAWKYFEDSTVGKRAVCVWHRRAGKDLFAINIIATKALERVGLYWHLLPTYNQGRKIVWNGFTRDGRRFLDHFPEELVVSSNATEMRLELANGSIYQIVGTDNIDSLVGTNPVGCVFSEYSLQDPGAWDLIRPILAENQGWALFIYTARGHNHGYELKEMAQKNKKWFCEVLVAGNKGTLRDDGLPVIGDDIIQEERDAGMPEEMIEQEFYCSFEAPMVGAYYGPQMKKMNLDGRITNVPHEPLLPVHTAWDLGIEDPTCVIFYQVHGLEIRIIDMYESSGDGIPAHANEIRERGYSYKDFWAPHDIKVRDMSEGRSRIDIAKDHGIRFKIVPKHNIMDGIEAARSILPRCWIDKDKCAKLIEALRQYRKDWDEKAKIFKPKPLHDWTSHPADAFRYMSVVFKDSRHQKRKIRPRKASFNHDPLGL